MSGLAQSARHASTACATWGRCLIAANSLAKGATAGLWYMCGCRVLAWQPLPHPATVYTLMGMAMDRFACEPGTLKTTANDGRGYLQNNPIILLLSLKGT